MGVGAVVRRQRAGVTAQPLPTEPTVRPFVVALAYLLGGFTDFHDALVNLFEVQWDSALGGSGALEVRGSGGFRRPGDVVPGGEAVGHLGAIVIGGEPMAVGPEMRRSR